MSITNMIFGQITGAYAALFTFWIGTGLFPIWMLVFCIAAVLAPYIQFIGDKE